MWMIGMVFSMVSLPKTQRLLLGLFVLLIVDLIWVATSELPKYFFEEPHQRYNDKTYFNTFVKSSMFAIYLVGFLFHRSWWYQCRRDNASYITKDGDVKIDAGKLLSDPVFVPIKFDARSGYETNGSSSTESEDISPSTRVRAVRFSKLSEVRHLSEIHAEEAILARLSYSAYMQVIEARLKAANKLSVRQIIKIAVIFSFIFFFGNFCYQQSLKYIKSGVVTILLSTSALFTLVLASVFPATNNDRFTLSKLVAVAFSIGGIVLMSLSTRENMGFNWGVIWSVMGALLLALFLVFLRRMVDNEEKLNMPMFYGFLGFFTLLFLWPGLLILHFTNAERLEWPDPVEWLLLVLNGVVGMVISNLLWLWGCFLTSSLIATLALGLTIPMTTIAGVYLKEMNYNWMFYIGIGPVFLAYIAVCLLSHYDNCDPVWMALRKTFHCIFRRRYFFRLREPDREQSQSLIGFSTDRIDT